MSIAMLARLDLRSALNTGCFAEVPNADLPHKPLGSSTCQ